MKRSLQLLVLLFTPFLLQSQELEKVSLQLQWLHQFQFAGYYVAKEKGFYEEAGLDVTLLPFKNTVNSADEVLNGNATYGIGRSSLIIDRSEGKPVVLMASAFQSSPSVLVATEASGIKNVKDFAGKRVMMTSDAFSAVAYQAMANHNGVSLDDMIIQKHSLDINDLIDQKTDLMSCYLSNEPFLLEQRGIAYTVFDPKEYDFDFYSDILFSSEEEIANNPDRAERFREASLKGWTYAFSHIEETVAIILDRYNVQHKSKAALTFEAEALKKLAYYRSEVIGRIDTEKIEKIYDFYYVMGLLKNKIDIDCLVWYGAEDRDAFMLNSEEKAYLKTKKEIRACIDPDWMPFEKLEDGKHIGMNVEYMQIMEKTLGVPIRVVPTENRSESLAYMKAKKCDILSLAMETPERKKYMGFTRPYLTVPLVFATTIDTFFIADIEEVLDKRLGVVKGYAFTELLQKRYPDVSFVEVETVSKGLEAVRQGRLYAFIDNLTSIGYLIQNKYMGSLKISGRIDHENWELGIGVHKDDPILLKVFDKAVASIDEKTKHKILNQWVAVNYEAGIDYALLWKILGAVGVVVAFLLYHYYMIKRHNVELKRHSTFDALTNVYNRRYLDQSMNSALELARRYGTPFSVIMMDVDDFKKINDIYGHDTGDRALIKIAKILSTHSRSSDIVGRWGGEEFLVICANSRLEGAVEVAEKMRDEIETSVSENEILLTASFGVVEYHELDTSNTILYRVDQLLYQAKADGKNSVVYTA
ncbi:MAG: ABC transporter substrate-binding protein [Sulfurimonadaceae bacterium]